MLSNLIDYYAKNVLVNLNYKLMKLRSLDLLE